MSRLLSVFCPLPYQPPRRFSIPSFCESEPQHPELWVHSSEISRGELPPVSVSTGYFADCWRLLKQFRGVLTVCEHFGGRLSRCAARGGSIDRKVETENFREFLTLVKTDKLSLVHTHTSPATFHAPYLHTVSPQLQKYIWNSCSRPCVSPPKTLFWGKT